MKPTNQVLNRPTTYTTMKTYAILRSDEMETLHAEHDTLYKFKYSKEDQDFYIKVNGHWIEETSTAFNFLSVSK